MSEALRYRSGRHHISLRTHHTQCRSERSEEPHRPCQRPFANAQGDITFHCEPITRNVVLSGAKNLTDHARDPSLRSGRHHTSLRTHHTQCRSERSEEPHRSCKRPFANAQDDITLRFHNPYLVLTQPIQIVDQFINPIVRRLDLFFQPFLLNRTLRHSETLMQRQHGLH